MKKVIEGKPLAVSSSIGLDFGKLQKVLLKKLHQETITGVKACFLLPSYAEDGLLPENGNPITQFRILLNRLRKKYSGLFAFLAKQATERMIARIMKNANSTLAMSLREMGEELTVKTDFNSPKLKDITQAAIMESVELIKTIPQTYLSGVQKVVLSALTEGQGFKDIRQHLETQYKGNARKAELTAMDQTRKVYRSIQAEKMRKIGVRKFKWLHSGGGREPRELHVEMNGKIYELDDPPFIGVMYGERIHGLPGQLPNCKCQMIPVFDFELEE